MTTLQHERETVQQLRREANIKRINVSQAAEDLKVFAGNSEKNKGLNREKKYLC